MNPMQTDRKPPVADAQPTMSVRMAGVVRMTGLGRSTIYRLSSRRRCALPNARWRGGASTSKSGAPGAPRHRTDGDCAAAPYAGPQANRYAGMESFRTMPTINMAAATLPQRQVVNQ